jgi:preprotein translocase subunit SecG
MWVVYILVTLLVLVACLLIFLVIIQNSKGGGINTSLGGVASASQIIGVRKTADIVEKATWWMIGLMVALTFGINISYSLMRQNQGAAGGLRMNQQQEGQRIETAPTNLPNLSRLKKEQAKPAKEEAKKDEAKPEAKPAEPKK